VRVAIVRRRAFFCVACRTECGAAAARIGQAGSWAPVAAGTDHGDDVSTLLATALHESEGILQGRQRPRGGQAAKGQGQRSARRCAECDVKLPISACIHAMCRCAQSFCAAHMHEHKCTFDYRTSAQQRLRTSNPKLKPAKMSHFV